MRRPRLSIAIAPLVLLLGILALAAAAHAMQGQVQAEAVHGGKSTHHAQADAVWIGGDTAMASAKADIRAASVHGTEYAVRYVDGPGVPDTGVLPPYDSDVPLPETEETPVQAGEVRLEGVQMGQAMRATLRSAGDAPLNVTMSGPAFASHGQDGAWMDRYGISEASDGTEDAGGRDAAIRPMRVEGHVVVSELDAHRSHIDIRGDILLEIDEFDLALAGSTDPWLRTVTYQESVHSAVPSGAASFYVDGFARITLLDAHIRLTLDGMEGSIQVASRSTSIDAEDGFTLVRAQGTLLGGDDGDQLLDDSSYASQHRARLDTVATADGLQIAVSGHKQPSSLDLAAMVAPFTDPSTTVLLVAVLSVGFVVIVFAAAGLAGPSMHSVESALGRGEYNRAARLAGRILDRRPREEGAMVARAVALSKEGQHGRVIREVEARLAEHDPADGVLHYVLGLAYLQEGQTEAGSRRLREAARRTPALEPDVERRLPSATGLGPYGYV